MNTGIDLRVQPPGKGAQDLGHLEAGRTVHEGLVAVQQRDVHVVRQPAHEMPPQRVLREAEAVRDGGDRALARRDGVGVAVVDVVEEDARVVDDVEPARREVGRRSDGVTIRCRSRNR